MRMTVIPKPIPCASMGKTDDQVSLVTNYYYFFFLSFKMTTRPAAGNGIFVKANGVAWGLRRVSFRVWDDQSLLPF